MQKIKIAGYRVGVPGHPLLRIALGVLLISGGVLGFLPVVGFWMIPLGLGILAIDFPPVRKFHRRMTIKFGAWLHRNWPSLARRFGYGAQRPDKR